MKSVDRMWENSLSFLDNIYVKVIIYVVLILLASTYFENINMSIARLHKNYKFMNIIVLLLVIYLSRKCPTIGILLAIVYIVSIHCYNEKENFFPGFMQNDDEELKQEQQKEDFIPMLSGSNDDSEQKDASASFGFENNSSGDCKSLYTPEFEAVGNVCSPVSTFQNELNAQGLNSPEGFGGDVMGSPL